MSGEHDFNKFISEGNFQGIADNLNERGIPVPDPDSERVALLEEKGLNRLVSEGDYDGAADLLNARAVPVPEKS